MLCFSPKILSAVSFVVRSCVFSCLLFDFFFAKTNRKTPRARKRMLRLLGFVLAACTLVVGSGVVVVTPRIVRAVLYEQGAILTSVATVDLLTPGLHGLLVPVRETGSTDTDTFQAVIEAVVERSADNEGGDGSGAIQCPKTDNVVLPSAWIAQMLFERVPQMDSTQEHATKERIAALENEAGLLDLALTSIQREQAWVQRACDTLVDGAANGTAVLLAASATSSLFDAISGCTSKLLQLNIAVRNTTQRLSHNAEQQTVERKRLTASRAKVLMMRLAIRVSVPGKFRVRLTCVDKESSWEPWYEMALTTHNKALAVRYAASVTQRSTANWTNVSCELCTGRIQRNTSFPVMEPWRVSLLHPWQQQQQRQQQAQEQQRHRGQQQPQRSVPMTQTATFGGGASTKLAAHDNDGAESEDGTEESGAPRAEVVQSSSGGFFATFVLPEPVTLVTAGGHQVGSLRTDIATFVLPNVTLLTVAVPRFRNHAFLRAVIRNESPFAMLSARGRAFVDGALVGDVAVPFVSAGGVNTIDLGVDRAVQVSRRLLHQETSEVSKYFFTSATEKRANKETLLLVENRRQTGADVVVRERLPLVEDGRLEILVSEPFIPDTLNAFAKAASDNSVVAVRNNVTFLKQQWLLEWRVFVPAHDRVEIPLRMTAKWPVSLDVDWGNE